MKLRNFLSAALIMVAASTIAAKEKTDRDIPYSAKTDTYSTERLKVDVSYPEDAQSAPVVVWFHGGGLEGGSKELPSALRDKGYVLVGVNYRLLPNVRVIDIIDDAAEAVAWAIKNAAKYGGDPSKTVVSGHSAGGYLSMMLCLDKKWLDRYGVDADSVAAYIPFSGQAITHFNARKMDGIDPLRPVIDDTAPLYWVRPDCPPLILITGDRELELYGRYEENAYLDRMMKLVGHKNTKLLELDGFDHGGMAQPAFFILNDYIRKNMH
ncbi:MAG: alpha/beta hydrolase [Muribaculaceae bacterium]|nr:alpha/beta hydrolase [Muribaculaceae bacterium]